MITQYLCFGVKVSMPTAFPLKQATLFFTVSHSLHISYSLLKLIALRILSASLDMEQTQIITLF